jgi:hypothetical protein
MRETRADIKEKMPTIEAIRVEMNKVFVEICITLENILIALRRISRFLAYVKTNCGEGEIRTPDTVSGMPLFESGTFNHSVTSPYLFRISPRHPTG